MDKQLKYLLFTLEYPPFKGGVSSYYENLVKHFSESIDTLNNNNDKLISKKLPFLKWLPAILALKNKIKNEGYNYVIVGNILPLGTTAYLLSKFLKFKYAVILHGTDIAYTQKSNRKKKITKKILTQADKIICNSSNTLELTKKAAEINIDKKTIVVNPGINIDIKVNQNLKNELIIKYNLSHKIILLSLSRLIKRKGQDKVIQALQEVISTIPNVELFIAGEGEDRKYLEEITQTMVMIKDQVHFLGKITEEEKWVWYDLCDLFVLPSREEEGNMEGFGIVYIEANLAGKTVIAGDSGGIKDAVKDGVNGVLVDPNNVNRISDAIIELAQNEDLRNKLGEQGRQRAIENFNWEKQIKQIYDFIDKPTPNPSEEGDKKIPS